MSPRRAWKIPNAEQRRAAIGKVARPATLLLACQNPPCEARFCEECSPDAMGVAASQFICCPHSKFRPGSFEPKTQPRFNDWLSDGMPGECERRGQTYQEFLSTRRSKPSHSQRFLYLCNMDVTSGSPNDPAAHTVEVLREFVEIYFGMPCLLLDPLNDAERKKLRGRSIPHQQLLTTPLENLLHARKRGLNNAFAVAGVTMTDLFPDENWNFVFGEACPARGVGVFSFARYTPTFYSTNHVIANEDAWLLGTSPSDVALVMLRAMKTLAHEIGHLFGLAHCVFYQCVMNGANHLCETDESPLHLCPVCLRKLHNSVSATGWPLDHASRYARLARALSLWGLQEAASWYEAASARCTLKDDMSL